MRRPVSLCAAVLSLAWSLAPPVSAAPPLTAVKAGRFLDVDAQEVRQNVTVVIADGRVRELAAEAPPGAAVIDLSSYTVMPGMIDAHTHVLLQGDATEDDYDAQLLKESLPYRALGATRSLAIALEHGFTTLRDIGNEGSGYTDVDLKRALAAGIISGPRLFVATRALAPTGAYGLSGYAWELTVPKGVEMCDGADACRRAVRDQIAHGADWIKVYADRSYYRDADGAIRSLPNFTLEEMRAIVDQAHRTRRRVAAHSITPVGHAIALGAGVDSIEHGAVLDEASIQTMVERGVFWCPTMTVFDYVAGPRSETNPIWNQLRDSLRDSFRRALAAGVTIVVGTDAGGFPWDEVQEAEELRLYVEAGMTPWQALRAATVNAAALLEQSGEIGTLAPGARADLVALDGDPLADITATQRVVLVMQEGEVVADRRGE